MKTPILFLIFNRPDTTQKVFATIRAARPKQLFVAADGPRPGKEGEKERCEATRAIIKQVDWECEVKTLFREKNLGCGISVSSAIAWFFENVEDGIILEDDCLPHNDYYRYCEEMLDFYRDEPKVKFIGGCNFQDGIKWGNASYYFSAINHVWGWASWKRVWREYDFALKNINVDRFDAIAKKYLKTQLEIDYWKNIFNKMKNDPIDTWDYQLTFSIWNADGVSVIPNVNLVSNLGFGEAATHTTDSNNKCAINPVYGIFPIEHPKEVDINRDADRRFFLRYIHTSFYKRVRRKLARIYEVILKNIFSIFSPSN